MVGNLKEAALPSSAAPQLKAPMGANIEQGRNIPPNARCDDDAILADMAHNKIADVGKLTDMRHPAPRPRQNMYVPQLSR